MEWAWDHLSGWWRWASEESQVLAAAFNDPLGVRAELNADAMEQLRAFVDELPDEQPDEEADEQRTLERTMNLQHHTTPMEAGDDGLEWIAQLHALAEEESQDERALGAQLMTAAAEGSIEEVQRLVRAGAPLDYTTTRHLQCSAHDEGFTPLMVAVSGGHQGCVVELLKAGTEGIAALLAPSQERQPAVRRKRRTVDNHPGRGPQHDRSSGEKVGLPEQQDILGKRELALILLGLG